MWWTSPERLYLSKDGRVVRAGDPDAATLLVGKDCRLPMAQAIKHGLVKHQANPPATKHRAGPSATKGLP